MTGPTRLKLVASYDLRLIDPVTGKKEPLAEGEGCTCDRCGKTHAVVYQVAEFRRAGDGRLEAVPGTLKEVGSACFRRLFNDTPSGMGYGDCIRQYEGKDARRMIDLVGYAYGVKNDY